MSWKQQNCGYEETRIVHPWAKYPWRQSYLVWVISGATFLCFLAASSNPANYTNLAISFGDNFRVWQLLTSIFTETNLLSLLGFLLLQLMLGVPLEHEWSHRDLALVYLLSGIGSSLLYMSIVPHGTLLGSPMGAVSGLLAAAWYHLGHEEWNVFMIKQMRLRTIIMAIMVVTLIMCLPSIVIIVPISGFGIGFLYCLLEKKLRYKTFIKHKVEKQGISKIEID